MATSTENRLAFARIDDFVSRTREAIFVRAADGVLMIRPDKTMGLNATAVEILAALYDRACRPASAVLAELAVRFEVASDRLVQDAAQLIRNVGSLLNEDFTEGPGLRLGAFDRSSIQYPTLAEIALTYECQNRCTFCYAASPDRSEERPAMTTAQVKRVMHRIFHEAHVPSLSFTGGEATLRKDLPELIGYGKELGFRVNLISNGVRAGTGRIAERLVEAGLDSAQISLEAAEEATHDSIVGRRGAFRLTVEAVRRFARLGIHVHTNSTLCAENLEGAADLIRFVARDLKRPVMSMNMLIRTGSALDAEPGSMEVSYREIGDRLPALQEVAAEEGIRLVWYSPVPYCVFNPVLAGLGAKSCACIDGILSVDPTGQVLPCSSFETGIGSLLDKPFASIYRSRAARYWRDKRFLPPACEGCSNADICGGACPLYWDAAGTFAELPRPGSDDPRARRRWEKKRRRGGFGVSAREDG